MKRFVTVIGLLLLLSASSASADHIGIFTDATGSSCTLAPGPTSSATLIHTSNAGATGSLFAVSAVNAPGSVIFSVGTPVLCVVPPCPYVYGGCYTTVVVGTITAILQPGYIEVVAAEGQASPVSAGCDETAQPATGGRAYIGSPGDCFPPLATESTTWGRVKSLYR